MSAASDAVAFELDLWAESGRIAKLWLRDDDATAATPALAAYLDLAAECGAAPLIAAIPSRVRADLVEALAASPDARVAIHGWAHSDHAMAGAKKSEFPETRTPAATEVDLRAGLMRIADVFGPRATAVLVPPWNRISPAAVALLAGIGFRGLSTYAEQHAATVPPGIVVRNTHIDLIDWRGGRRGKPVAQIAAECARALTAARLSGRDLVGILTHHLDHDAAAEASLRWLLTLPQTSSNVVLATPHDVFRAS